MRRIIVLAALSCLALGCQAKRRDAVTPDSPGHDAGLIETIQYSGNRGATCDDAIVITGARGEQDGVGAEYAWIAARYPGYRTKGQALGSDGGKSFDTLTFETAQGETIEVCFDITAFFGKW